MKQELRNKFNEMIQELNDIDVTKLEDQQKTLEDMLEKTRDAINIVRQVNTHQLVAGHMSSNIKSAQWFELDRKQKTEPVVPKRLLDELQAICTNENTHLLSCLMLGLHNGYWIQHAKAFEQFHTVDFYPDLPKELETQFQPKFLNHILHTMLDPNFDYTNLDMVPNDEVGYMISWDFLPYFTVPQLEKLFTQVNDKLIKGAKGLFHFANADNKGDLDLIKKGYYQYCDQKTITEIIFECTNFDIEQVNADTDCCSYLKFKKPGDIDWKKREWWRYNLITKRDPEVKLAKPTK